MTTLWETPYTGDTYSGDSHTVYVARISNGIFWTHATNSYVDIADRKNYLRGVFVSDGLEYATIYLPGFDGAAHLLREIAVDQNGYIWTLGITGRDAFKVIDPVAQTVVQSLFSQTSLLYSKTQIRFDPINNLMWTVKENATSPNTATIVGISTTDYTEQVTIDLESLGHTTIYSLAVDSTKGEIWVFYGSNLRVFRCSDGTLLQTIAAPVAGTNTFMQYIPEKEAIILYRDQATDIYYQYSTSTYTSTRNFTSSVEHPVYYNSFNNLFYGTSYDSSSGKYVLAAMDWDDPTTVITTEPLEGSGDILYCRKAAYDCRIVGIQYDEDYPIGPAIIGCQLGACSSDRTLSLCTDEDTSSDNDEVVNYDAFNRELILDLTLGAFSIYDIAHDNDQYIRDYVDVPPFYLERQEVTLYRGNDVVTDGSGNPLTIAGFVSTVNRNTDQRRERFKFLVTSGTDISLAEYKDYRFVDWYSIDGAGKAFNSYLLTGYELSGDMLRNKQTIYLKIFFERTEDGYTLDSDGNVVLDHQSACQVQSHWNWNNSAAQGKWGIPFQGYRLFKTQPTSPSAGDAFDYGERVIVTKNKLRGRGHCLSILFVPGCGKDTKLLGWALDNTMNTTA